MTRFSICIICLCFVPATLLAHQEPPCLARLAQLAQSSKGCQLEQTEKGQCDDPQRSLEAQTQHCKQQLFTEKSINKAIQYGYGQLQGDVEKSPYRRQVRRQQFEYQLMKPNLQGFQRLFPEADHIQDALMERFNTDSCPKQYAGDPDRYRYFGSQSLARYPGDYTETSSVKYVYHWFAAERPGTCYGVPNADTETAAEEGGPNSKVVNVPDFFLSELEKRERVNVVRCRSDCREEQVALAQRHEDYAKQYRRHRQLLVCSDIEQRNADRPVIKGVRRSAVKLPDYCPEGEIEVEVLNSKGLLQQLDQRLFQDVTLRIETAKSE